jgi:hypothetical protein
VRRALAPRGILYVDEYVGPSRDEWGWRHLLRWNVVYRSLPAAARRTHVIRRPINREDPTEAIASSGILPAVESHFRVLARRDYGGNLLAPIYPSLLRSDQPGGPPPELFDGAVRDLLDRRSACSPPERRPFRPWWSPSRAESGVRPRSPGRAAKRR